MALDALAHGAYAAALDEVRWAEWTHGLARAFGGRFGTFNVVGADLSIPPPHRRIFTAEPEAVDRFMASGVVPLDPQIRLVRRIGRGTAVYRSGDHIDLADPGTREYQGWLRANARVDHHLTAWFPAGADYSVAISIHRGVDDGSAERIDVARLSALLPAMRGAATLAFAHGAKLAESYWDAAAGTRDEAAMLIDDGGRVLRVTAAAEALLARGDGLDIVGGRLRASHGGGALRRTIATATARDGTARSAATRLPRASGRPALVLTMHPLVRSGGLFAPFEAAALATIVDPTPKPAPLPRAAAAFGLTPREAEIAALLVAGRSPDAIARELGIGRETVRVHLRHLFAKSETRRQADLVGLLARIG